MTFEEWKEEYGLVHEPNYSAFTEADCLAAFNAGYRNCSDELCEKCGKTRQHAGGGCIHCITEWCKEKVREAHAENIELANKVREECAQVCESQTEGFAATSVWDEAALSCARAIRAMKEPDVYRPLGTGRFG